MKARVLPAAMNKIHSALPPLRVAQTECCDVMVKFIDSRPKHLERQKQKMIDWYTKCTANSGIDGKNMLFHPSIIHTRGLNDHMLMDESFNYGKVAITKMKKDALEEAEIEESELAAVFLGTEVTTGSTLDLYTHFTQGCNPHLESFPMHGQGCVGGVKNLAHAHKYLQTHPEAVVHVVNFDSNSQLWGYAFNNVIDEYLPLIDNPEHLSTLRSALMMAIIIGDAGTLTTLVGEKHRHYKKWIEAGHPYICGSSEAILADTAGTVNVMKRPYGTIPLLREEISLQGCEVIGMALDKLGANFEVPNVPDFTYIHPGGARVLRTLTAVRGIPKEQLKPAYDVLRAHSNCASPTVMLEMKSELAKPTERGFGTKTGLVAAIGPGMKALSLLMKRNQVRPQLQLA